MRDNWQLFKGALHEVVCENMIETFSKIEPEEAKIFSKSEGHRKSKVRWVKDEDNLIDWILKFVTKANMNAFGFDIHREMGEMQFTEYDASYKGKYDWHHDVDWQNGKNFDRKLSVVLQLSHPSNYKGGNFEFSEVESPKPEDFKTQGSILVFPSYLTHRVTEVTEGTRYSLVSWVRGPRWR